MLNPFGNGKKRKAKKALEPKQVVQRLSELMPPSTLVYMVRTANGREADEDFGRAVFLQRDKKVYREGDCIYISTPEGLKASDASAFRGRGEILSMQFLHRRVPHKFECRVVGRFRLLPEVIEALDFRVQSAYKLLPVTPIRKEEKRHYLRYTVNNYGNARVPITTHVNFDIFADATNQQIQSDGAPPVELKDLRIVPRERPDTARQFDASDAVQEVRGLLLANPTTERQVHLTKVVKSQALRSGRRTPEEVFAMGSVNILGLEKELTRPVLYTQKSPKYDGRRDCPYDLAPGDRVLMHFRSKEDYYEVLCDCQEARVQNEVLRPIAWPLRDSGLRLNLVEYSVGGAMVESSPELLKLLLGRVCPPDVDNDPSYEGRFWERVFEELQKSMIHLTFYPKLHFGDKLEQYKPDLPFKIPLVAQIVRTRMHRQGERGILQHGLRFIYDPQEVPLTWHEIVPWKLIRGVRDNTYFTEIHSKLSLLYGFLEHRKQSLESVEGRSRPPRRRPTTPAT